MITRFTVGAIDDMAAGKPFDRNICATFLRLLTVVLLAGFYMVIRVKMDRNIRAVTKNIVLIVLPVWSKNMIGRRK